MKIIHTGDWHLGRLFHNIRLTDDQRFTLEGLVRLAEEVSAETDRRAAEAPGRHAVRGGVIPLTHMSYLTYRQGDEHAAWRIAYRIDTDAIVGGKD